MANRLQFCHRISRLFQPIVTAPPGAQTQYNEALSKSYKLMIDQGIIAPSQNGFYYLLPLATRALNKLTKLVEKSMMDIGAQNIICPTLTDRNLWKKTDRLSLAGPELFQLTDRHDKNFLLSPTHEESISHLLATLPIFSYKHLPILLYQITYKFRDEMRPRFGLIRSREFLMKDLYSFDSTTEAAHSTYGVVSEAYHKLFETIGVNFIKVKGVSGMMGGQLSHEFHYPAAIGDDTLRLCNDCGSGWNREINEDGPCEQCGKDNITETKGIEVGHTFMLDTRYSAPLRALYTGVDGRHPFVMGSYGLGLSRILAATLEILSLPDQLRWPTLLAPYSVVIITPKEGSKESKTTEHLPEELYWSLQGVPELENNIIIDDRSHMTIGKRLQDNRKTGYPYIVVVGKEASSPTPMIELHNLHTGQSTLHSQSDLIGAIVDSNNNHIRISVKQ